MIQKDYYSILGLNLSASPADIKRSYRKLAMKYHPDKNDNDSLAEMVFREIAEAYEILSDPKQREEYNAKNFNDYQQRKLITKQTILQNSTMLQKVIAAADPFRMNKDAVYFQLSQILTSYNIELLQKENDTAINSRVIDELLLCAEPLNFNDAKKIADELRKIAGDNKASNDSIADFLQKQYRSSQWNKYKAWIAVVIAIALCLLIFLLSK